MSMAFLLLAFVVACGAMPSSLEGQNEAPLVDAAIDGTNSTIPSSEELADLADSEDQTIVQVSEVTTEDSQDSDTSIDVVADTTESIPPLAAVSEDFTLVGETGRTQFIFTYADW
ncbi:MAG: hypothetical protein AAF702_16435 [Chloroflexota bacterium]